MRLKRTSTGCPSNVPGLNFHFEIAETAARIEAEEKRAITYDTVAALYGIK